MHATGIVILTIGASLAVGLAAGVWIGWRWYRRRARGGADGESADLRQHLQRAQRMEALGILSGSIMHNLNNLLSVVIGQARLVRDDLTADTPPWRSLGQVIQAAEVAAELSREVDGYQSEIDHDRRPVRLQAVVRATVKLLRDILPDTVHIETDLDPGCGPVLASTTQVQQVLMSLCSNAYHAMYRRRGRISVSMTPTEIATKRPAVPRDLEPGSYVQLSVADNGRGMDTETLQHIFEPYFSARSPRRGAGLGLTMVSRLLAANEGVTIPSSLPGHGTRFDIYFPIIARGVRAEREPGTPAPGAEPTAPGLPPALDAYQAPAIAEFAAVPPQRALRPAHILVVEDDSMVADTVRTCLERSGMRVTTHDDGAAALAAFAADPGAYDLLLTDQFMRGLDGREVIAEVRRVRPRLPVILMSGHPEGLRREEIAALGMSGALAKPFSPAQLVGTVRTALRADQRVREGQA
ncbi:MAG TPA: response regulator [Candidatus Krumholzibacteria bacterium]|nr:response regulator [Candidatus Krumholzibacteria bacterium]HPD71152.1 response regulator [Candidatus Krumholzibacteria bacterium]HRY39148.1 response regulator [Candidatus Krumholzibacteria bacterium]